MVQKTAGPGPVREIVLLCSFCGKLRNDAGGWEQVDRHTENYPYAYLSHGICPVCAELQFPNEYAAICLDKKVNQATKTAVMA